MNKKYFIFAILLLSSLTFVACQAENNETIIDKNEINNVISPIPSITNELNTEKKLDITFNEYYSSYSGYIDEIAMFDFTYDNRDYDKDGKNDRIYREVFNSEENGVLISKCRYRIDFGNGEVLEIGDFSDLFTGIQIISYDITGDKVNEIIFLGQHMASTFPNSYSEIAVYAKKNNQYEMLDLPKPDDWNETEVFKVGYSIYIKDIKDNQVTISCPTLDFEEIITIDSDEAQTYFIEMAKEPIGSFAWNIETMDFNETPTLLLYIDIGYKYYNKDLIVYLIWQNDESTPIKVEI